MATPDSEIKVKTINGTVYTLKVNMTDSVMDVKQKMEEKLTIRAEQQKILWQGKVVADDAPLNAIAGFESGGTVHMMYALRG